MIATVATAVILLPAVFARMEELGKIFSLTIGCGNPPDPPPLRYNHSETCRV